MNGASKNDTPAAGTTGKTVYDRAQLCARLGAIFPDAQILAPFDLRYARLAHDWVAGTFAEKFRAFLIKARGTDKWAVAYDCDKFARSAADAAGFTHFRAQKFNTDAPEGVTFGVLCYNIGGRAGSGHAINVVITERGVETWEPQTQQFVQLTEAEKQSAWLVLV